MADGIWPQLDGREGWTYLDVTLPRWSRAVSPLVNLTARISVSMHAKLLGGFLVVALLLVGMGLLSLGTIEQMNQRVQEVRRLQDDVVRAHQMLYDTTAQMHYRAMTLLNAQVRHIPWDNEDIQKIVKAKREFLNNLNYLEQRGEQLQLPSSFFKAVGGVNKDFSARSLAVQDLYQNGQISDALTLHLNHEHPISHVLEKSMRQLFSVATRQMTRKVHDFDQLRGFLFSVVITCSVLSVCLALFLGFILSWSFILPVRSMSNALGRISTGDFKQRVHVPNRDELGFLSTGLDRMSQHLEHAYESLQASNEQLAVASHAKSEFLGHMCHDLRGLLNVILGFSELLVEPAAETKLENLKRIRSNGEVMRSLLNTVLDLSAAEAGKVQLDVKPFDARSAFAFLRMDALTEAKACHKELDITVTVDPAITSITADEHKFYRIMHNLISNAVKFTATGGRVAVGATIEADRERSAQSRAKETTSTGTNLELSPEDSWNAPGRTLHVTVSDTGIGIAAEHHERIFEPFQRIDTPVSRQYPSTGLGLALVRQLVALHGGRIWLESTPGEGSTFHVVFPNALPLARECGVNETSSRGSDVVGLRPRPESTVRTGDHEVQQEGVERRATIEQKAVSSPAPHCRPAAPPAVLLVEDMEADQALVHQILTAHGYMIHTERSAEEALVWLADHRPDVILLDIGLPGMDGLSFAKRIKGQVETASIPVVAVTGEARPGTEEEVAASGCAAYLIKPISVARLLATLEAVSDGKPDDDGSTVPWRLDR